LVAAAELDEFGCGFADHANPLVLDQARARDILPFRVDQLIARTRTPMLSSSTLSGTRSIQSRCSHIVQTAMNAYSRQNGSRASQNAS
jgi:hypothetical protein